MKYVSYAKIVLNYKVNTKPVNVDNLFTDPKLHTDIYV